MSSVLTYLPFFKNKQPPLPELHETDDVISVHLFDDSAAARGIVLTTLDGLAILGDMWNLMINEPEDREIDEHFAKEVPETMPKSSGACFSWELKPGEATPEVKIYLSLPQFFRGDKAIVEAMEKVFRKQGWAWGVEGAYKKVVSDAYGSDVLDDGIETPTVHTFVSFNFSEKKGVYMTTYVAPFIRFL